MENKDTTIMNGDDIKEVVEEIKSVDESTLEETIKTWYNKIHTDSMKLGAYYISMGVYAAIQKNIKKTGKVSLRDYKRTINDIMKILEVQLGAEQNDLEEKTDDGTTTESSESNS